MHEKAIKMTKLTSSQDALEKDVSADVITGPPFSLFSL